MGPKEKHLGREGVRLGDLNKTDFVFPTPQSKPPIHPFCYPGADDLTKCSTTELNPQHVKQILHETPHEPESVSVFDAFR